MSRKKIILIAFVTLFAAIHKPAAAENSTPPVSASTSTSYLLRPMDVIEVTVYRQAELNKKLRITPDGTIDYPLVPRFSAAGHGVDYVAETIRRGLQEKYIQDPLVTVSVIEYAPKTAYIWGAVEQSREIQLPQDRPLYLTQAIAMANNFTKAADRMHVLIYRLDEGKRSTIKVDVDEITEQKHFDRDVPLRPGDSVYVPSRGGFFVRGSVKTPGYFSIGDLGLPPGREPTVSMSIAVAGDFAPDADRRKVQVVRYSPADPLPSVFIVDMEKVSGKRDYKSDIAIRSGDLVFVPSQDGVFVTGEVKKPGMYTPAPGKNLTALRAVALAGGFTQWAGKKSMRIYRTVNGKTVTITVNLTDFLKKKKVSEDRELYSGDILYVPEKGLFE